MQPLCSSKEVRLHSFHLETGTDKSMRVFNPSVAVCGGKLISSFRISNIERDDRRSKFYILPETVGMRNEAAIVELNSDLSVGCEVPVTLTAKVDAPGGFEDIRLIESPDGRLEGICCVPSNFAVTSRGRITFGADFAAKIARLEFGSGYDITKLTTYASPFGRRMEKNWAPFYYEGKFCVIYQWNPLIVLELLPGGTTKFVGWFKSSSQLKGMRGATQGVRTANGYLFVVHHKHAIWGKVRFSHQFIELGLDLRPRRMSERFSIMSDKLIEYVAGMAIQGRKCVLSMGVSDSLPFMVELSAAKVESMLTIELAPTEPDATAMADPEAAAARVAAEFPEVAKPGFAQRLKIGVKEKAMSVLERFLPI